jgi:Alpha/beta hydrolase
MVDVAALRLAQPGLLERAAGEWQMLGGRAGSQVTALHGEVMGPLFGAGEWTGMAADAASASLSSLARRLSVTGEYAAAMASLLRDAASGIGDAQSLAGIASVQNGIDYVGQKAGIHNVYLLGFSTSGNGRAIIAVGNPDTAANTVTYVPGVGSKLTMASGDVHRATALWQEAATRAPGTAVSSIYWLGYNAPQLGVSQGLHNLDMASAGDAVTGGQALAHFGAGLQAAHQPGVPSHTVVLGHSYGTLVAGEAATHDGMHPSDMIFIGSPGVGVSHAAQLGIAPAHVWAGANSHDPVPDLPPLNPVNALSGNAAYFGTNAATSAFGGHVFNADAAPPGPSPASTSAPTPPTGIGTHRR